MRVTLKDIEGHELVVWLDDSVTRPAAYGQHARWLESLNVSVELPPELAVVVENGNHLVKLTGRPPMALVGARFRSPEGSSGAESGRASKLAQYRLRLRRRVKVLGDDVASEAQFWSECAADALTDWLVEPVRARCAKWLSGLGAVLLDAGAAVDPVAASGTGAGRAAGTQHVQHVREMLAALGGMEAGEHLRVTLQGDPARGRTKLQSVTRLQRVGHRHDGVTEKLEELRQHLVEQHALLGLADGELEEAHRRVHQLGAEVMPPPPWPDCPRATPGCTGYHLSRQACRDSGGELIVGDPGRTAQPAAQPSRYTGYVPHYEAEREGATAPAQAGGAEDPDKRDEAWGEPGTPGEISVPAPQLTERHDPPCLYGSTDCVMGNVPHTDSGCITQEGLDRVQAIDFSAPGAYEGKPCPREVDQCIGGHSAAEGCRNETGFKLALWRDIHMGPSPASALYALHQNTHQESGGPDYWGEGMLRHHLARQHHLPDPEQYIVDAKGESPPVVLRWMHSALHHPSPFQQVTVRGRTSQERDELRRSGPPAPPSSDVYPNIDAIPAIETHEAHSHPGYPTWGESTLRWHLQQHHGGDLGTAGMDLVGLIRLHERSHNHGRDDWPGWREPADGVPDRG